MKSEWIRCPICGSKTRDRIRKNPDALDPEPMNE